MRINRAYTDAGASGKQGLGLTANNIAPAEGRARPRPRDTGDKLHLSPEALELLASGGEPSLNASPDDGLYDQYGNLTRQFDTVQNELRRLASQFSGEGGDGATLSRINGLRGQLAGIRATV